MGWGRSLGVLENQEEPEAKGGVGRDGPGIEPGDVRKKLNVLTSVKSTHVLVLFWPLI